MEPKAQMLVIAALIVLVGTATPQDQDQIQTTLDDGCLSDCGGVLIPYPFGVGNSSKNGQKCFLQKTFNLKCKNSTLIMGNIPVKAINITQGKVDLMIGVSKVCYNSTFGATVTYGNLHRVRSSSLTISPDDNKFMSVGCDTYGYLDSFYSGTQYSTGCLTRCYGNTLKISDGNCSGIGCCQVDIPPGMRNITEQAASFENFNSCLGFNNCSYSFVVKNGSYTFRKSDLLNLTVERMPVVFDWTVGGTETCHESKNRGTNACKGNSTCVDSDAGFGYRCQCKDGFQGNPYHPNGCTDVDECKIPRLHNCITEYNCNNTIGSYNCFCPHGQSGNGTKEDGCHHENPLIKYVISGSAGLITLFVAISLLFLMYQKRKLIKLKEKFFKLNGGLILQSKLKAREQSSQAAQIFTADQLKKASNNYDESLIIGKGGYGTVFKGTLEDKRVVAIKKSIIVDKSQIEQFINEVVVLSQINHRNIVKLLGCCLETEVPLLVYEYINNGTLFDFIQDKSNTNSLSWNNRLRIAAEAAGSLSYLHSYAAIPIIHRDVKSANILLDQSYTAKVSDFGASRLVPLEQNAVATMVQGTFGYLDPEYMQTSELTEKSDVYSFGVVLLELLTGEKPVSEEKRSLATYFLSCLKENRLVDVLEVGIWNEENKKEMEDVAVLAARCLRLHGEERPSMKEVAMELEGIRRMQKQSWINNSNQNLEETEYLLPRSLSKVYEHGDSSSNQNTGYYDSIKDQVLLDFDDGR